MTHILVVFTGGTIGSVTENQEIDVHSSSYFILEQYSDSVMSTRSQSELNVQFTPIQPINQLSENVQPQDWTMLYYALKQANYAQYDGVILTHGSDTLAYTSIAMSYMFADSPVPIVTVASNKPLDQPGSNGLRNFAAAVDWIATASLPGVYSIYENVRGQMPVYLASRLLQCRHFTDDFDSTLGEPFAWMENGQPTLHPHTLNPDSAKLNQYAARKEPLLLAGGYTFTSEVLAVRPHPGQSFAYMGWGSTPPKAILLDTYHSATLNIRQGHDHTLVEWLRNARAAGIPVYLTPVKQLEGPHYATTHVLLKEGVIPLVQLSFEAALVKLMLAYGSLPPADIADLMTRELFFEQHSRL
ncbi:asparaginase [Marinicrinis sediminis]|uniref:asparaginase n=1 Tax=Marinicrinis sediminis TaxID=1652465 RepID=A0ABW5RDS3_9BACL